MERGGGEGSSNERVEVPGGAKVLLWIKNALKTITQIGGCGAKIRHGNDPGLVIPA